MTMHSCKGLEFKVVYILDTNEGITPHHKAVLEPDLEEERRMFYVAMTRAKDRLHIFYVKERYHKRQTVSRFVVETGLLGKKGDLEKMENREENKERESGKRTDGLVHIYCGDGKGKTTASVGAAVRAAGSGKKW